MPLYEYKCVKCGHRFEKIENVSASETKKCPKCGARAERMFAAPAIQFKGSGWYVTDYAGKKGDAGSAKESGGDGASKSSEKTGEGKTSDSKSSDSKSSDSKPSDSKSESKSSESKSSGERGGSKRRK